MWINIIDYRGDDSIVNSRGDTLFNYRTKYFFKQQEDFHYWKLAGHKFRCFTQHQNRNPLFNDYSEYDDVVKIPRSNASQARNYVLNYYSKNEWIGVWDNDATLYWDKLESRKFPYELDNICQQAQSNRIVSFIPFNAQQAPYPKNVKTAWTFKPKLEQKGTMLFLQVKDWRFDESMDALGDLEFACSLISQGYKFAQCEQVSLKEMVHGKSTVFQVNAHHKKYKKPGPNANPDGLLEWDAQIDRANKYKKNIEYIESKLGSDIKTLREQHKKLWNKSENKLDALFE